MRWIIVAVLVVLAGVGFWMLVMQGGDDGGGESLLGGRPAGQPETVPEPPVLPSGPLNPIEAQPFNPAVDSGSSVADISRGLGATLEGVVRGPSGTPLGAASVVVYEDVSPIKMQAQEGEALARLQTSDNGRFQVRGLLSGTRYVLLAGHPAYASERRYPIDPDQPPTLFQDVTLEDGYSVSGLVTDSVGLPIEDVEVTVYNLQVNAMDPDAQIESRAMSAIDGTFSVRHLGPGTKKLIGRKPGYSSDGRAALEVRRDNEPKDINLRLDQGFTIEGIVMDRQTSQPVAGAHVQARPVAGLPGTRGAAGGDMPPDPEEGEDRPGARPLEFGKDGEQRPAVSTQALDRARNQRNRVAQRAFLLETTVADDQGRFVLTGLTEARYMIMVRADGYQPFAGLQVDAGARGVPVEILPSASIAGTVVDDATGEPVAGFSLSLSPTKTPTFVAAKGRQRFEDGQGRFRYTDVRPGTHFLTAEAEGYAGGSSDSVVVTHGQQLENVVVRMVKGGELTGRVVSSSGEPVGGAKISLKGASDPSEADPAAIFMNIIQQQMRGSSRAATSGPDGIWTMPFVMPGDYKVSIAHADFAEGEAGPVSVSSGATTEVGDVILSRGALIEGLVLTADGEPDGKAQVMISATSQFGSKSYPTDPNGSFRASGLKAGTYRIVVTQREGQFRLLDVFLQQKDPSAEYTVSDGQVLELILQDKKP